MEGKAVGTTESLGGHGPQQLCRGSLGIAPPAQPAALADAAHELTGE